MKRGLQGRHEPLGSGVEGVEAFIPAPLPPQPPLQIGGELQHRIERASHALGRLEGASWFIGDPTLFARLVLRREAILSFRIEGRLASLPELFLFESGAAPEVPYGDVEEVARLVAAHERGVERVGEGAPVSVSLLRELHGIISESRGDGSRDRPTAREESDRERGEGGESARPEREGRRAFRSLDTSVPATHSEAAPYVPPPGDGVPALMETFDRFLIDPPQGIPTLVRAALAHHQLQAIQPFAGAAVNGVFSRLLAALLMQSGGALPKPLLCLSLHLKEEREAYRDHVERVRLEGEWEGWIGFFLAGIERAAESSGDAMRRIHALEEADRARIASLGRGAESALAVHRQLLRTPLLTIPHAGRLLPLTPPTLSAAFRRLEKLGIVQEVTGRLRDRLFVYRRHLDILNEGTEPYSKQDLLAERGTGWS